MTAPTRRARRLTIRATLALAFTSLVAAAGLMMVVIVSIFMRTVPTYASITVFSTTPDADTATAPPPSAGTIDIPSAQARPTALTLSSADSILNASLIVSVVVLVVIVTAGAFIAWRLAGRMLRPLQAVNDAAQRAGTGAFDHRIALDGPRDEVRDLADRFDEMLARLDRSFAASQRFAANASHELQTPLATTQTMLEVALADDAATAEGLRGVAERVLATNRRSIETVSALLDLAELEERTIEKHPTELTSLVRGALREDADAIAAHGLHVDEELPAATAALGDAVLLRQAVSNLVRNAVRHNTDGGTIRVEVRPGDHEVVLIVENTGAELDEAAVASFVEPFVRGSGRIARGEGHGLGLAIVDSVVRVHDGELRLRPRPGGGLTAEVSLPAAAAVRA